MENEVSHVEGGDAAVISFADKKATDFEGIYGAVKRTNVIDGVVNVLVESLIGRNGALHLRNIRFQGVVEGEDAGQTVHIEFVV